MILIPKGNTNIVLGLVLNSVLVSIILKYVSGSLFTFHKSY